MARRKPAPPPRPAATSSSDSDSDSDSDHNDRAAPAPAAPAAPEVPEMTKNIILIFGEAQKTKAGHRKLCNVLRKLHLEAINDGREPDFMRPFVACLTRTLATKQRAPAVERILDFVQSFIAFSRDKDRALARKARGGATPARQQQPVLTLGEPDAPAPADEDDEDDFISTQFAVWVINFLLRGIAARDKIVRYRCARLIFMIASHLTAIDDDLFESMKRELYARCRDKEPMVRREVVAALAILQGGESDGDTDTVQQKLIELIQFDPSPAVRKSALNHIAPSNATIAAIISRCRDEDPAIRRAVHRVLATHIPSFEQLSSALLSSITTSGLRDPDEGVRKSCVDLILGWVGGSPVQLAKLLARLNVVKNQVAELIAVQCLRGPKAGHGIRLLFTFDSWRNLTPETALMMRCYTQLLMDEAAKGNVAVPVPRGAGGNDEDQFTPLDEIFIIEHLAYYVQLHTNHMITNADESLDAAYIYVVQELLTLCCMADYGDPHGRRLMFALVRNMISSIAVPEELIPPLIDLLRLLCVDERDFIRVVHEIIVDTADTPVVPQPGDDGYNEAEPSHMDPEEDMLFRHLKCLIILRKTLEATPLPWTADALIPMHGLVAELVAPAPDRYPGIGVVIANAIGCLGLISLTSRPHAIRHAAQVLAYASIPAVDRASDEDLAEVVIVSLRALFDLVLLYGTDLLGLNKDQVAATFAAALADPVRPIAALAVQGCVKLMLANRLRSADLLAALYHLHFTQAWAAVPEIRDCLDFFAETYPTILENKRLVAAAFGAILAAVLADGVKGKAFTTVGDTLVKYLDDDGEGTALRLAAAAKMLEADEGELPLKPALQLLAKWSLNQGGRVPADRLRKVQRLVNEIPDDALDNVGRNALKKVNKALVDLSPMAEEDEDAAEEEADEEAPKEEEDEEDVEEEEAEPEAPAAAAPAAAATEPSDDEEEPMEGVEQAGAAAKRDDDEESEPEPAPRRRSARSAARNAPPPPPPAPRAATSSDSESEPDAEEVVDDAPTPRPRSRQASHSSSSSSSSSSSGTPTPVSSPAKPSAAVTPPRRRTTLPAHLLPESPTLSQTLGSSSSPAIAALLNAPTPRPRLGASVRGTPRANRIVVEIPIESPSSSSTAKPARAAVGVGKKRKAVSESESGEDDDEEDEKEAEAGSPVKPKPRPMLKSKAKAVAPAPVVPASRPKTRAAATAAAAKAKPKPKVPSSSESESSESSESDSSEDDDGDAPEVAADLRKKAADAIALRRLPADTAQRLANAAAQIDALLAQDEDAASSSDEDDGDDY
ncbi:chromosome condensation complex Condensin, subunit G [Blastocladiella emersonii ATCC 22665]|nr:chromosome condensation complex Condensin, subunit G [Blastocladiella emersonii ATCC 22665]